MNYSERLGFLRQQLNAAMQASIVQDRMLGQAREKAAEIQGRINMLVELQQEEKAGENKNTDEKPEKTSDRKPEAARSGPKLSNKSRAKKPGLRKGAKWTPEIDEFIRKNSGLKNQEILKRLKKKFGIKTTLNGLAYNISAKGLRKNRLRAAAEAELDDDDEEDLKTLPPPDMPY